VVFYDLGISSPVLPASDLFSLKLKHSSSVFQHSRFGKEQPQGISLKGFEKSFRVL